MEWSPEIAYVVGLIATDGSLSKDGRHINLTSKDKDQIETFAKILKLKNKISLKSSGYTKRRDCYQIQFGNIRFYKFLLQIGLTPNKTKTIAELIIPDEYFADFLRGSLDGDGYTHSYWDKRWKSSFMLYLAFTSASLKHLDWIRKQVNLLYRVSGAITFNQKSTYQLRYAKNGSLKLLKKMYYKAKLPCLQRKRSKINQSLGIIYPPPGQVGKLVDPPA